MKFEFKVWKLTIGLHLIDADPSDGKIMIGISFAWR